MVNDTDPDADIKFVVERVESADSSGTGASVVDRRRVAEKRTSRSCKFCAEVITDIDNGMKPVDASAKYKINESMISRWRKDKVCIMAEAASECQNTSKLDQPKNG